MARFKATIEYYELTQTQYDSLKSFSTSDGVTAASPGPFESRSDDEANKTITYVLDVEIQPDWM